MIAFPISAYTTLPFVPFLPEKMSKMRLAMKTASAKKRNASLACDMRQRVTKPLYGAIHSYALESQYPLEIMPGTHKRAGKRSPSKSPGSQLETPVWTASAMLLARKKTTARASTTRMTIP